MTASAGSSSVVGRIQRVVDHIDAHLADPLDLATLAAIAHVSPWHFHRVFQAATGETLADRVRRRRIEIAAARLLGHPPATALSIALDVGFASAEVFTRAFRQHFGVTPTAWRRGAYRDWAAARRSALSKIHQDLRKPHQAVADALRDDAGTLATMKGPEMTTTTMPTVEITTLPASRIAYLRHTGAYGDPAIGKLWERFSAWAHANGRLDGRHVAFGLSRDNPDITAADRCRYDACVTVDADFKAGGEIGVEDFGGGLYAYVPFHGTGETIHHAWMQLFSDWLPDSAYQPDDRSCVELYGPALQLDPTTGAFSCRLCLPVRPR